ncbi:hypothetical protein [Sphingomonas solaris]|uniref:XRE family transcriptional regulator n=1 Tax=Alterirhizorhabdus solaris TaxID=2529389 RepID=A0A558RC50_9SPHN|nr:hypothetical protein [Sphingomonas solaris]TVV76944.1 hypothetical protein FOY91_02550 [Sphingomonas solaris]
MNLSEAQSQHDATDQSRSSGRVDFILARMSVRNLSRRQVASITGIGRTRLQTILHAEVDKRTPMRMDEFHMILEKLGIGQLEVAIAADVIDNQPDVTVETVSSVVSMLAELMRGLPRELIGMVYHIDGLEHSDVRPEHGGRMRELVVRSLASHYRNLADRRDMRINNPDL